MDIYQKYGVGKDISTSDFMQLLEDKKQLTLRKLNNVFDNPEKEAELRNELDEIEATELIIKNGYKKDSLSTGLYEEEEEEKEKDNRNLDVTENDAEKMFTIAVDYDEKGNYEKALDYFQKAANLDHSSAQFYLGYYYANGEGGIRKDIDKAIFWYEKSARQGSNAAMNNLGIIYDNRNNEKCVKWYEKAIEAGNDKALKNLILYYERRPEYIREDETASVSKNVKNYLVIYKWLKLYSSRISDAYEKSETQKKLDEIFVEIEKEKNKMPVGKALEDEFYNKGSFSYYKYRFSSTELCKQLNGMLGYSDSSDEVRIKKLMNEIKNRYDEMRVQSTHLSSAKKRRDMVGLLLPIVTSIIYAIFAVTMFNKFNADDIFTFMLIFGIVIEAIAFIFVTYDKRSSILGSIGSVVICIIFYIIALFIVGIIVELLLKPLLTKMGYNIFSLVEICITLIIAHFVAIIRYKML